MSPNPRNDQPYTISVAAAVVVQANSKSTSKGSRSKRCKPCKPSAEVSKLERDVEFWYSDGNVVIRAETLLFKLHRSRLSRYCAYFRKLFAVEEDSTLTKGGVVDGYPIHRLPTNISAHAFKQFLIALEKPLAFVKEQPSEADAYIMLDTSHALSCPAIFDLAKDRLARVWDSTAIPPEGTGFSYQYAAPKIAFFRDHDISGFLKRAYYEVLADREFWRALSKNRGYVPTMSDLDLHVLYEARHALQRLWREFVVIPPRTCKDGRGVSACARPSKYVPYPAACVRHTTSVQRSHFWLGFVMQNGQLEAGAEDPVRYNMIKTWRLVLATEWCDGCLNEWENAWLEKRKEWWIVLDKLLKL